MKPKLKIIMIIELLLLFCNYTPDGHAEEISVDGHDLLILTESNIRSLDLLFSKTQFETPDSSNDSPTSINTQDTDTTQTNQQSTISVNMNHKATPLGPKLSQKAKDDQLKMKRNDLRSLAINGIIQEVARLECKSHTCGDIPCVDFVDFEISKRFIKREETRKIVQKEIIFEESGPLKKITVRNTNASTMPLRNEIRDFKKVQKSEDYKKKHPKETSNERSPGPVGIFLESVECTDDPDNSYKEKYKQKRMDYLLDPNETLRKLNVELTHLAEAQELIPCGQVVGKTRLEKIAHSFEKNSVSAAIIASVVEVAINVAPVMVGLAVAGPVGAIAGSVVTKNTGMTTLQNSLSSRVRAMMGYRYETFESDPQKIYFSNLRKLEFLESQYEPHKKEFSENNRTLINHAFLSLKSELARSRIGAITDKLSLEEQKLTRDKLQRLMIPLSMATTMKPVKDDSAEHLEHIIKHYNHTEETEEKLFEMAENIDRVSTHSSGTIHPYYYIRGDAKSGKSELVDNLSKAMGLPTYHIETRNNSIASIEAQLDEHLLKSPVINPIIILDNMDELIGRPGDKREQTYAWLEKLLESRISKVPRFTSKIATDALLGSDPKIAEQIGSRLINPNQEGNKIYHDLSKVTFLLAGESALGGEETPSSKKVAQLFYKIELPGFSKETLLRAAHATFDRETSGLSIPKTEVESVTLEKIVDYGIRNKLSAPITTKVILAYVNYLRHKKEDETGIKSKYKRKSTTFELIKAFEPYIGKPIELNEPERNDSPSTLTGKEQPETQD